MWDGGGMLTQKQHDLLMFLAKELDANGVCPSYTEMMAALNIKSKSEIHRLVTALEQREFIYRIPHLARAIEVIRLPDSMIPELKRRRLKVVVDNG